MPFLLAGMSPNNVHIIYIFTFALEASLLGQIFITETILSQQRTLPVKIPADLGVSSLITPNHVMTTHLPNNRCVENQTSQVFILLLLKRILNKKHPAGIHLFLQGRSLEKLEKNSP